MSVRKFPAILAAAGLLVSLSACATGPSLTDCTPSGNALLVTTPGAFGADPEATFPTPIVSTAVEVAEPSTGDGAAIGPNDAIEVSTSIYAGEDGTPLNTQAGALITVTLNSFVKGQFPFTRAFECTTVGSRLVVTGTAEQLFGPDALGLDPQTTLVTISDVDAAYPAQATGTDQFAPSGIPAVVFTPVGQPGFTFPDSAPPSELTVAALKQGSGRIVKQGDTMVGNVTGIVWGAKTTFASSFTNQAPAPLLVQELAADGTGIVQGLATALIGQKVGSRLVVVVPPSVGYPAAAAPAGVVDGDTLVFVVDILAIR